jgi:lipoprotein-anchoring transpeptidase ErfK/SrfK
MKHHSTHQNSWQMIGFLLIVLPITIISLVQCTGSNPSKPVAVPIMSPTLSTQPDFSPLPPEAISRPVPLPETVPAKSLPLPPVSEPAHIPNNIPAPSIPPITVEPTKIEIDVSTQTLNLYTGDKLMKTYPISSAKSGVGSRAGSDRTPLGRHYIAQKIGAGEPQGMIFKARRSTGKLVKIDAEKEDVVTSRIMWLKGLEVGKNVGSGIDSYQRYIYIHGTNSEKDIGRPASHGCIRMYNKDVIELFDQVKEKLEVNIICSKGQNPATQECQYDAVVEQKMATK